MEVSRQCQTPVALPGGNSPQWSLHRRVELAKKPFWTLWRREECLASGGNRKFLVHVTVAKLVEALRYKSEGHGFDS